MITVSEALDKLLELAAPLAVEEVPLRASSGRTLARPVTARRDQPPFSASAMDGYAIAGGAAPGDRFEVIGEAAAGHGFSGSVGSGQAVRIFTGAPMPEGATRVVIQEDTSRDGGTITLTEDLGTGPHVRALGADFRIGDTLDAPRLLSPSDVALMAAMNIDTVPVTRRPDVAIIATGDELVQPGEDPGPDQIIASNSYGLAALVEALGATARLLPIARDTKASLQTVFDLAEGADLILTIGGASVGDHDLVGPALADRGMERAFYKVAMRPGKPLMAGRLGDAALIGLPGNPVSAMVCGHVFVAPVIRAMLGQKDVVPMPEQRPLAADLPANGPRQHYLRARTTAAGVIAYDKQDSSLLSVLSEADCLIVQPPGDPGQPAGRYVDVLPL
ncbi:molybdopterin molybdotransferase MoeA [Salibaculum griseiflavum]|uniref:Molybdopterin molybdenumtransferase n=1 Tax=Salibaculum griseiflavum TaxID=1914409 RepID=A0A2V1P1Q5_9RHOB|nr:gephyrin-like molybdotransferase Glp [Salibaculum griseiflavum]PWG16385.1 molybdopterin molybdenumtransferase MoeA [Salibaculum griseiflavum]